MIDTIETTEAAADSTATGASALANDWSMLKTASLDDLISKLAHDIISFFISLAIAVAVFYLGRFLIRKLYVFVAGVMVRRKVDQSLSTFILSLVSIVLYFILIVISIGILGINTSSFIALFASAGVAIGMALSGTLQNFAGGVLILLLKPYRIGDYIEAQGFAGTVTEIQIFSTIICTPDNKSIIIPNGPLSTGSINNWSREDYRRVEWTVSLAYGDNAETAKKVILDILSRHEEVVKTTIADHRAAILGEVVDKTSKKVAVLTAANPGSGPTVALSALADSSINFTARAWVPAAAYWTIFFAVNEELYNELPKHGLNFPFPQLDVHLTK